MDLRESYSTVKPPYGTLTLGENNLSVDAFARRFFQFRGYSKESIDAGTQEYRNLINFFEFNWCIPPAIAEKPKPKATEEVKSPEEMEKLADRQLDRAKNFKKQGKESLYEATLKLLIKQYPNTKAAVEAKKLLERK